MSVTDHTRPPLAATTGRGYAGTAASSLYAVLYREGKIRATNVTFIFWDVFFPLGYMLVFGVGVTEAMGFTIPGVAVSYNAFFSPVCSAWRASASPPTPRGLSSWTATTASSTRC